MITFYDEKGNGYGAQVELTTKNAVNGERSISGTIVSNNQVLSKLDRGWSFTFEGELYKIIYAKPKDEGRNISLSFDAVHQFFYDFDHSNCYKEFNGSNRFEVYIEAIFKDSGYRYVIEAQAGSIRKENFGNTKRLSMFKDIIKAAGLEFSVTGKVVRIVKKVGTDLSTVVRKNFNMNELTIEKNIGGFITYKKGLGAWKDENNHDAGRYTSEYESPLARIYGRIEGEPVKDERYKETGKLLERLKKEVDESYSISVQLDMEDLAQAGYKYTRPRAGDYIMAINETIGFREKIRIVSYESSYDVTGRLLSHKVTCNDIGTVQKAITSEGSIMRSVSESKEYAEGALEVATRALVSANGKNTNYYGATKPKDEPRGTLHEGDLLYLTVGEETELYYWSGSEWVPKILKVDTTKIEKIVNNAQASTTQAIAQADAKAEEALKKAGTLPDTSKLSDQIKQQILSSPDLSRKVAENLEQTDSGVIYNKIYQNIQKQFVPKSIGDFLMGEHDRMRDYQSYLDSKIERQTIEFNKLTESNKLYERIIGTSETDAPDRLSRLVMSSDIFQTEVGKYVTDDNNLIVNSMTMATNTLVNASRNGVEVTLNDGVFSVKAQGLTGFNFTEFQQTFTVREDFLFGEDRNFPFYIYLVKNGWVEFKEPILVRGSNTGPYKPSQFDDAYKASNEAKSLASDAQAKAIQVAQGTEAVRTQVTQLNNSYSIRNLNSAGDVLGQLNLNPDGSIRINEGLLSIGEKTYIKDGVIKKSMIGKAQIDTAHIKEIDASQANIFNLNVNNINGLNAEFIKAKIEYALVDWLQGKTISAINGKTVFNLNDGRLSFRDNNTGIFRDEANASSQGMMFLNNPVSVNGRTMINSRVVIGADRRDNDVNRNWNHGGFNGMVVDTIKGTITADHDNADKVTLVGDRIKFTHSYEYDPTTNSNPYGWQINTWLDPTILPFGTNSRGSKIFSGDFKLLNKSTGTDGFWLREVLRTLINCWQHFANVNYTTAHSGTGAGRHNHTLNDSLVSALRSELQKLQSYGV